MSDFTEKKLAEFKKQFGHHGEIWNGKRGLDDGLEVKDFSSQALSEAEKQSAEKERKYINDEPAKRKLGNRNFLDIYFLALFIGWHIAFPY